MRAECQIPSVQQLESDLLSEPEIELSLFGWALLTLMLALYYSNRSAYSVFRLQ